MFDEVEAIWLELNQGGQRNCIISCIYRPPSSSQEYYSKIVDVYDKAQLDNIPMISMGDLNHDYKLDESSSNNPIYNIKMGYDLKQIIGQPTRETIETIQTSTTLDIILVFHPDLHKKNGVMKYNFSDHYLVNETNQDSVNIIIVITYDSSTSILDSLHTIEITLSSASPDGESIIQFGLNIWFIYFKQ